MKPNEKSRQDKNGRRWNFHYWNGIAQRLFFWDDAKTECGVILFLPGATVPYTRIRNLIIKLVFDPALRQEHRRELVLPLDDRYFQYPLFQEKVDHESAQGSRSTK